MIIFRGVWIEYLEPPKKNLSFHALLRYIFLAKKWRREWRRVLLVRMEMGDGRCGGSRPKGFCISSHSPCVWQPQRRVYIYIYLYTNKKIYKYKKNYTYEMHYVVYSPRQPVGRKMARHQIKQIDLKSWEYKGIHHSKSAYWGRFLKTLLKFRDPLTGGFPWRMFSVDLFLCNSFLDLYVNLSTYIFQYIYI